MTVAHVLPLSRDVFILNLLWTGSILARRGLAFAFDIPLTASTESDLRNPDKAQLRADILAMLQREMCYRQIARVVGLHWTRVQQIIKLE